MKAASSLNGSWGGVKTKTNPQPKKPTQSPTNHEGTQELPQVFGNAG